MNPVYMLAREFIDKSDLHKTMEFYAVSSDGAELESRRTLWDDMWAVLDKIKNSEISRKFAFKTSEISVFDYISANWQSLFVTSEGIWEKAIVKSVIEWQSYYATNWEKTSIGSLAVDVEYKGDQLLIKNGGYTRILDHYLDHYNLRDKIRINCPVAQIERTAHGCIVSTKSGERFEADIVVVTVSLGVLKHGGINFIPPLPEEKQKSIDLLGFGVYDKIFITFKESIEAEDEGNNGFWRRGADVISIVPGSDDDYNQFKLSARHSSMTAAELGQATAHPRRPYEERSHDHIGIEMANLSAVAGVPKLVMLLYGKAALQMEDLANDNAALSEFALSKLRNAFPGRRIPEVDTIFATCWGNDEYSYGSFANIPMGASGQDMLNLSLPVENKILFAGEATFPLHYSTVHGALKSGRREFARIMSIYNHEDKLDEEYNSLLA